MTADQAPAREWYDLAVQTTAVKGWSVADLASKSGVARTTIYGWRDNPRKPHAKSVNAVADVLEIPRERALRAAGIIVTAVPGRVITGDAIPKSLLREIMQTDGLTPQERQAVIDAVEKTLAKERGGTVPESGAAASGAAPVYPERHRPAS